METGILFVLVLGLLFLGVPVAVSLGLSSIIVIAFFSNDSMSSVAQQLFTASQNYTLLAIPLFILAADIMNIGSLADRLLRFAQALVGRFRGGLGHVNVVSSLIFSGSGKSCVVPAQFFTGASPVWIAPAVIPQVP